MYKSGAHTPHADGRLRAAWQSQLTAAKQTPGLLPLLYRQRHDLLPHFATAYRQLRMLPRRVRRRLQRHWRQSLAGLALGLALGQGMAVADTINVDDTTCTLINAIVTANTDVNTGGCAQLPSTTAEADTIVLQPSSVHTLTAVDTTYAGPTGLPVITSEIVIEGHGSTIQRDSGAPNFRILAVNATGNLTLKETTVSGGQVGFFEEGGGIANYQGVVTLLNSTLSGNSADYGGGVFNLAHDFGASTLTIINSTFSGNSAHYCGAGVDNGATYSGASTVTISNSTFSGNSAGAGGGVFNCAAYSGASTVTISDSTFSGNSAGAGGGVSNRAAFSGARSMVTINNSTFSGNSANVGVGGGVGNFSFLSGVSTVTISDSTFSGNFARSWGGGVGNIAASSGVSTVELTRSLLSGNTAPIGAEVTNYRYAPIIANNHNLLGHRSLTNAQAFAGFTPGATDITTTPDGTIPTALSAILNTTLADNGGPTLTHNLVPSSPAIDASPDDADCQPTDQRGIPRPLGAACDIGAVEFFPTTLAEACGTTTPTIGCKVNGVPNQPCLGTPGDDVIVGTQSPDVIFGLGGNDIIKGRKGDDCIDGGPGDDRIEGGDGKDALFGGGGNEQVRGGKGDDLIVTGSGKDTVQGEDGDDLIYDTGGRNTLRGRGGNDIILAPGTTGKVDGGGGVDVCIGGTTQSGCP
ncbi:MAG: hypothetical protein HY268_11990 [Deltaproteobacteria bacterium]|nr:hypothetical protein [Deltaproteobacteria bacterium]